jgi:hypothetical protein
MAFEKFEIIAENILVYYCFMRLLFGKPGEKILE